MRSLSLLKNLSLLVVLNFIVKPVWIFFIDRQIQNTVGHEVYGSYFSVLNLSIVLSFLADAGLTNMVNQRMASGASFSIFQIIRHKLALSAFYTTVVLVLAYSTGLRNWPLLFPVLIIQVLTSFFVLVRNIITAWQLFRTDAWLSVIDKILMIVIAGGFLYLPFGKMDMYRFLYLQVLCTSISIIIALYILLRKQVNAFEANISIKSIIQVTLPFTILVLFMSVHARLDGFLLERLHVNGAYEAGIYASSFRLLDAANMVGYLAASFIVPFVARNINQDLLISQTIVSIRNMLLLAASFLVPFVIVFADDIQNLLYHNRQQHAVMVTQYCILALPGYFLTHVYGSVLTASSRLRPFTGIVVTALFFNLLLNVWLIPSLGALACCIAAATSQTICGLGVYYYACRKQGLPTAFRPLLSPIITALLLALIFYMGKNAAVNIWYLVLLGGIITLFIMFAQIAYFRKHFFSLN